MNFELCSPNTTYDAMNLELETNQFNQQSISQAYAGTGARNVHVCRARTFYGNGRA